MASKRFIYSMLKKSSKRTSLHMPGFFSSRLFNYRDIASLDSTELMTTDNLYAPRSAILNAQTRLANIAQAKHAYFLHNGSTAGIQAMILYALHRGKKIIVPRYSHISLYNISALIDMQLCFVKASSFGNDYFNTLTQDYIECIKNNSDASAVFITCPDYYGASIDIKKIADEAHKHSMLVLVDQAHGAHYNWLPNMNNALYYGADICVQSAHKTLPCFTSSAWLLSNIKDDRRLRSILQIVQTSSPSFIHMMSMDDAIVYMNDKYINSHHKNLYIIEKFKRKIKLLGYSFIEDELKQYEDFISFDPYRLSIFCKMGSAKIIQELYNKKIDIEFSDQYRIICILSTRHRILKKQLSKLYRVLINIKPTESTINTFKLYTNIDTTLNLKKAFESESEIVDLNQALGRKAACLAGLYPPGIPIVIYGEVIDKNIVDCLNSIPENMLFGVENHSILCIKEK